MGEERSPRRRFGATAVVEKPKERPEDLNLRMIYAPVLAYILIFGRTAAAGSIDAEKLRLELCSRLDRAGQLALMAGYTPQKVQHSRFSVVAFADEIIARSDWPDRGVWMERPLQAEEFDTNVAGDLFFERMEESAEVDEETAEIDYVILSMGFMGRHVGNDSEILTLRRRLFKRFPANAVQSVAQLTPEAYDQDIQGLEEEGGRWWIWKWVAVAGIAATALVIYAVLQWSLSGVVDDYARSLGALKG